MRIRSLRASALLVTSALALSACSAGDEGWTSLFNGENLDNWNRTGDANWRIEDGAAVADMGSGHLVTPENYGDFELVAEFWVDELANSGIFIRCADGADPGADSCYEVNIYDTREDPTYGTGAIVNVSPIENMPKAGGQWNTYEIRAEGDHLLVTLNGEVTADVHDGARAAGPLTLQYAAGVVKFRRVDIRPL
jgi:hypothetical protein